MEESSSSSISATSPGPVRRLALRLMGLGPLAQRTGRIEADQISLRDQVEDLQATLQEMLTLVSPPDSDSRDLPTVLRDRLDHALLHAEAQATETRKINERALAEIRSTVRLTQALAEESVARRPAQEGGRTKPAAQPLQTPTTSPFRHRAPTFDSLYRSFEDSHRGPADEISTRQATDYGDLFEALVQRGLPVVDLGCGRGELVALLADRGVDAIGVDINQGQLMGAGSHRFERADIFAWLDEQVDQSLQAVFSLHVIEHLPVDLQVRMVFEARRVLAPDGLLVLETPNALSVTTAATNFWVDPTHQRPVHPLLLEFLAREAGFTEIEVRPLHPLELSFRGETDAPELVSDLNSLLLGSGDIALIARR